MPAGKLKTIHAYVLAALLLTSTLPASGADKNKDEQALKNANAVIKAMLASKAVPASLLLTANCIVILPGVKKFAVGVGGSAGHGPMTCRKGKSSSGYTWSPPAMYSIGGASAGLQVGSSSTDLVLLILSASARNKVLAGKIKIGSEISAGLGSATAGGLVSGSDIVTYTHAKGLFAGTSLNGASLESDSNADERLYGKAVSARDIVLEDAVKPTTEGQSLILLLEKVGTT
jgi:lipid-binding SYLF domain-containing protein